MRKEFSAWIESYSRREPKLIFLTGDLGFGALENVQAAMKGRFVNMGVCEQNMVAVAAGLAREGLIPACYSIAPFAVFRPFEQIRLDVALHGLNVKIVGNGGGYGYGIMGASHHAIEDIAAISALQGFACFIPVCDSDVAGACQALFDFRGPSYLRLGMGTWPSDCGELPDFTAIRKLVASRNASPKVTVAGFGPVILNLLPWVSRERVADLFAISLLPLPGLSDALVASVAASGVLWVVEEHVARGGLGEHLAAGLARLGIRFRLVHTCAAGYPNGLYGSQSYHQSQSGMDAASLKSTFHQLLI